MYRFGAASHAALALTGFRSLQRRVSARNSGSEDESVDCCLSSGPALGNCGLVGSSGHSRDDDGVEADEGEDALEVRRGEVVRGADRSSCRGSVRFMNFLYKLTRIRQRKWGDTIPPEAKTR